jgi:hypothetical protein
MQGVDLSALQTLGVCGSTSASFLGRSCTRWCNIITIIIVATELNNIACFACPSLVAGTRAGTKCRCDTRAWCGMHAWHVLVVKKGGGGGGKVRSFLPYQQERASTNARAHARNHMADTPIAVTKQDPPPHTYTHTRAHTRAHAPCSQGSLEHLSNGIPHRSPSHPSLHSHEYPPGVPGVQSPCNWQDKIVQSHLISSSSAAHPGSPHSQFA